MAYTRTWVVAVLLAIAANLSETTAFRGGSRNNMKHLNNQADFSNHVAFIDSFGEEKCTCKSCHQCDLNCDIQKPGGVQNCNCHQSMCCTKNCPQYQYNIIHSNDKCYDVGGVRIGKYTKKVNTVSIKECLEGCRSSDYCSSVTYIFQERTCFYDGEPTQSMTSEEGYGVVAKKHCKHCKDLAKDEIKIGEVFEKTKYDLDCGEKVIEIIEARWGFPADVKNAKSDKRQFDVTEQTRRNCNGKKICHTEATTGEAEDMQQLPNWHFGDPYIGHGKHFYSFFICV